MVDGGSTENLDFALINSSTFVFSNPYRGNLRFGRIYFDRDGTLKIKRLRTLALPQRNKGSWNEKTFYTNIRFFLGSRVQTGPSYLGLVSGIFMVSFSIHVPNDRVQSYLVTIHIDDLLEIIHVKDGEESNDLYGLTGWGWDDLLTTPWTKWGEQHASFELAEDQEPEYLSESDDTPVDCAGDLLVKLIRGSPGLGQRDTLVVRNFSREAVQRFSDLRDFPPNTRLLYPKDYTDPQFIEEHLVLSSLPCVETRVAWTRPELDRPNSGNIWLKENRIVIFVSLPEFLYWLAVIHVQLKSSEDHGSLETKMRFK